MASFNPGTEGTLHSTTLENAALEIAMLLQTQELNTAKNRNGDNNVSITFNSDAGTISISIDLPIEQSLDSTGQITLKAKEYLDD